jgi:peptidoglycan/xylan/chitin deacetylase (PgdA/CDA1 family)
LLAVLHPRCAWLGPLVSCFRTAKKEVWLTLDDGPDGERTLQLSEQLRARGVCATFFVIGEKARGQMQILSALVSAGHTIANHTATHPQMSLWRHGASRIAKELDGGARAISDAGVEWRWFRAPVGHKPPALHPALGKRGWRLIAWTVGGCDGWSEDSGPVVRRVMAKVRPGSIVMLHESRKFSVETVPTVVDALLDAGYKFVIPDDATLE